MDDNPKLDSGQMISQSIPNVYFFLRWPVFHSRIYWSTKVESLILFLNGCEEKLAIISLLENLIVVCQCPQLGNIAIFDCNVSQIANKFLT